MFIFTRIPSRRSFLYGETMPVCFSTKYANFVAGMARARARASPLTLDIALIPRHDAMMPPSKAPKCAYARYVRFSFILGAGIAFSHGETMPVHFLAVFADLPLQILATRRMLSTRACVTMR